MEVEAGKANCKEFIHTDLVSAVNSGKYVHISVTQLQVTSYTYIGGKTAWSISEIITYLGFCKNNNTDDTYRGTHGSIKYGPI